MRFAELPLSAQTAYAELFEQTRAVAGTDPRAGPPGRFPKRTRQGEDDG